MHAVMILIVLVPLLLAAALLLVRRHRQQFLREELSPISRQHLDLFQGGQLSEAAVESTKARFRALLERGEVGTVEASLRAGMQYVVQVRALAELGTDDAGRILERRSVSSASPATSASSRRRWDDPLCASSTGRWKDCGSACR